MDQRHGSLRLRVVTLNTWGLWLVSRRRAERMVALAAWLRDPACPADVVFLQEAWVGGDVALLRQAGAEGGALPHSIHWHSGALGSGLLLLSRWPIAEAAFHPYSTRGDPAAVLKGDWFVGKGVGYAALHSPAGLLHAFNTHLSANYGQQWQAGAWGLAPGCRLPRDALAGVRLAQMLELAAFVRARSAAGGSAVGGSGSSGAAGVVLAGDLNSAPDTLEFELLKLLLPELRDAWAEACPLLLEATSNALESSFVTVAHRPARIDYILTTGQAQHAELTLIDTGLGCSYSDHLGVTATLSFGGGNGSGGGSGGDRTQPQWQQQWVAPPAAALHLVRQQPEPFQEAAAQIEAGAAVMARGRRHFVGLAVGLWAAGVGCLGALAVRQQRPADEHLLLLGGMGVAFGWAGVFFVGGVVGRGVELRALQQAALSLRLAVGTAAKAFSPRG